MTKKLRFEKHYEAQNSRIAVDYRTDRGQYHAASWQEELEILYLLNGSARIILDGEEISLVQGDFIVIDSHQVFELHCADHFMQIAVHVDRQFLSERTETAAPEGKGGRADAPRPVGRMYRCVRSELTEEQLEPYLSICSRFKQLILLYISEEPGYRLKTESVVLDILFDLVRYFSIPVYEDDLELLSGEQERTREILSWIEEHYSEPVTLAQIAGEFGLSREYFSRLFTKNVGISFTRHLNRVRISHIYRDVVATDLPIMQILEMHGFTNYKLFSRMFRNIYGGTPREVRRLNRQRSV